MRTKLDKRIARAIAPAALLLAGTGMAFAQGVPVQPRPADATATVVNNGTKTIYKTGSAEGLTTHGHPFAASHTMGINKDNPTNLLPTIYELQNDILGNPIPNTLPSTPENPYNLHADPIVSDLFDDRSPEEDLARLIKRLKEATNPIHRFLSKQDVFYAGLGVPADPRRGARDVPRNANPGDLGEAILNKINADDLQFGIDIFEGNAVNRVYSGMPLLNYKGPEQISVVDPVTKIADVHQVWVRNTIMSDTFFVDPSAVHDEEWIVRYTVDVVSRGHEDFVPFVALVTDPDNNNGAAEPLVAMDATFFPMDEGKRYIFDLQMPPAKYWTLTYHWGWRYHPSRIQTHENALKVIAGKNIVEWESDVFGVAPSSSEEAKEAAIDMIGELAPAKRMWRGFKALQEFYGNGESSDLTAYLLVREMDAAFQDWQNRMRLPRGVVADAASDSTLFYVNNTIYGEMDDTDGVAQIEFHEWTTRGSTINIKLLNGDYFPHAYINLDFGGLRGWENIFHNTLPLNGQGAWFTFGRAAWFLNTIAPAIIPPATRVEDGHSAEYHAANDGTTLEEMQNLPDLEQAKVLFAGTKAQLRKNLWFNATKTSNNTTSEGLGEHDVEIEFRFDPAQRLRFYQFDPLHHGVAIWSVH
jgi:hypothetical protein